VLEFARTSDLILGRDDQQAIVGVRANPATLFSFSVGAVPRGKTGKRRV